MILKFTAVVLACVLGASLGRPIEKRNATTTPCVDYTANYRKANSIMLESVKRVCRAVKDLDMFINVTAEQCANYPQVQNRSNFDDVLDDLEEVYLPLTTLAIHYGRSIDNTSCITLENENVRFNISTKLASVQTALQDLMVIGCRAKIPKLNCDSLFVNRTIQIPANTAIFHDFKCIAKYNIAAAIRILIEAGRDHDWYFESVGCR